MWTGVGTNPRIFLKDGAIRILLVVVMMMYKVVTGEGEGRERGRGVNFRTIRRCGLVLLLPKIN